MRLALTVSVKATLRPGAGMRARNARPYGSSKRYAHRFGVAANPLPVAMATGWQMEGVISFTRVARPYLRQQMPQIFGQIPIYLLLPKRKRGDSQEGRNFVSPLLCACGA